MALWATHRPTMWPIISLLLWIVGHTYITVVAYAILEWNSPRLWPVCPELDRGSFSECVKAKLTNEREKVELAIVYWDTRCWRRVGVSWDPGWANHLIGRCSSLSKFLWLRLLWWTMVFSDWVWLWHIITIILGHESLLWYSPLQFAEFSR